MYGDSNMSGDDSARSSQERSSDGGYEYPDPDLASIALWPGPSPVYRTAQLTSLSPALQQIAPLVQERFSPEQEQDNELDPLLHFATLDRRGAPPDPGYGEDQSEE